MENVLAIIQDNVNNIQEKINKTAKDWGRVPSDINLVAVSKKQSIDKIKESLDSGHRLFGENKVQEAYEHWADLKDNYEDIKLHMIGHLQTNKVKEAVALFDVIETVDSKKIAKKISDELNKQEKSLSCFIQVNTGQESQKYGVIPDELEDLIDYCRSDDVNLDVIGLMCIPPSDEPYGLHFAFLRKLGEKHGLFQLSMGMSSDYDKAIMAGASHIRIGTAIFGDRGD